MVRYLFLHIFLISMMMPIVTEAQEEYTAGKQPVILPSDTFRKNTASISFDKSFNTYHWNGITFYQNTFGPVFLQINEQFLSTLISANRKLITDNQTFDLRGRYKLTDNLSAATKVSSFILSDNKSVGSSISEASSHAAYGGIAYQPFEHIVIEPFLGVRFDKQMGYFDRGSSYLLNVNSDTLNFSGYASRFSGSLQYDKLDPRTLETHSASIRIDKEFFEQTRNHLQFEYYRNRRDFYMPADSALRDQHNITFNIESRSDNAFAVKDTLDYNVGERMAWTFQGNIFSREINRAIRYRNLVDASGFAPNTDINELKIEGSIRGTFIFSSSLRSSLAFSYLERDEKHTVQREGTTGYFTEALKNNHARRTTLTSETSWRISASDTIQLSGSSNLLRYDTPNPENDDDRDELWYLLNLSTNHQINQHLHLHLAVDASLIHLVYLFASRSADNNWNRIVRLAPKLQYTPWKEFSTTNTFEVLANYTAYDFEYIYSTTRSYAFRQFAFIDSSVLAMTQRLGIEWFSHVRLYERGELRWDTFAERPTNYFEEKTFFGNIRYILHDGLLFSIGIRYFSQLRFDYNGHVRTLDNQLRSIGPVTSIEVDIGGRTRFSFRGWYEHQLQTDQPERGMTTMIMSLNIRL